MKHLHILSIILMLFAVSGLAQEDKKAESVYTRLDNSCKKLKTDSGNGILYRAKCAGVGGYKLIFYQSEHHQSINLLTPKGKELELELLNQGLGAAPASLGEKVEWRIRRQGKTITLFALILRLNVYNDPDNAGKAESYLLIAKIEGETACVTDVIEPAAVNQNIKARERADDGANKTCRQSDKGIIPEVKAV